MLLDKINEEFEELGEVIEEKYLFMFAYRGVSKREEIGNELLRMSADLRRISQIEVILQNKKFESKIVQEAKDGCINCIDNILKEYDKLVLLIAGSGKVSDFKSQTEEDKYITKAMYEAIGEWNKCRSKVRLANEIVSKLIFETWEPLPDDKEEDNVNNIIISSETRSMSLNDVSSDVNYLDRFFNNICSLICQDKNEDNNIYLRKVETGSLTVAVSCVIGTAPIIAFMFWVIKLCQDTAEKSLNIEEKSLNNKEKKLKIINDEIDIAKKILEIQPDNNQANDQIQACAIYLWDFLENNSTGTINGKHYDIGIEKPKIEDKENK